MRSLPSLIRCAPLAVDGIRSKTSRDRAPCRWQLASGRQLTFGAFRLDLTKRRLWRDARIVPLTPYEESYFSLTFKCLLSSFYFLDFSCGSERLRVSSTKPS